MRGKTNSVTVSGGSSESTLKKLLDATKSTYYLFYNYKGTSVDDLISYSDTESVINMQNMFDYCSNLTTIPLLNSSNCTLMNNMFKECRQITSIDLFDTSNVTSMYGMFRECSRLVSIPLLNTSKVTNMQYMFQNCSKLTSIPLLNTSTVYDMSFMFNGCTSLTEIPALDVSTVKYMGGMFQSCSNLTSIHMTGMKASFNISESTKFTTEALHEIIGNLATVTSTQTLTMGATNLSKVSEEYKTIATNKGWTLA